MAESLSCSVVIPRAASQQGRWRDAEGPADIPERSTLSDAPARLDAIESIVRSMRARSASSGLVSPCCSCSDEGLRVPGRRTSRPTAGEASHANRLGLAPAILSRRPAGCSPGHCSFRCCCVQRNGHSDTDHPAKHQAVGCRTSSCSGLTLFQPPPPPAAAVATKVTTDTSTAGSAGGYEAGASAASAERCGKRGKRSPAPSLVQGWH